METNVSNNSTNYEKLPFKKLIGWVMLHTVYTFAGALLYILMEECYGVDVISSSTYKAMVNYIDMKSDLSEKEKNTYLNITQLYFGKLEESFCRVDHHNIAKWWKFATVTCFTIGYGRTTPKTVHGKLVTISYASIGVPLSISTYTCAADFISRGIRNCITFVEIKVFGRVRVRALYAKAVSTLAVIFFLFFILISYLNTLKDHGNLSMLDSCYFWFQTLTTIGFGDVSPTAEHNDWFEIIMRISQIFGLGITASLISSIATLVNAANAIKIAHVLSFRKKSWNVEHRIAESTF